MNRMVQKAIIRFLAVLFLVVLCFETQGQSILRLHVIANSNSAEDQRVKLLVRNAVLQAEQKAFSSLSSAEAAQEILKKDGLKILQTAQTVLKEQGADYGAELRLGTYDFPEKSYRYEVYPEGRYDALKIVLGEGQGDNWWCVMFPPLCLVDLDKDQEQQLKEAKKTVRFKSIIKELFEKWFKK